MLKIHNHYNRSLTINNEVIKPNSSKIIDSTITNNMRQLEDKGFITIFEVESSEQKVSMPTVFGQPSEDNTNRRRRKKTSENNEEDKGVISDANN